MLIDPVLSLHLCQKKAPLGLPKRGLKVVVNGAYFLAVILSFKVFM